MKIRREESQRGTIDFPLTIYCFNKTVDQSFCSAPAHYHNDLEILQVTEGKMELIIGNEQIIAEPNQLYFINPEEIHTLYTASSPAAYRCFIFGKDLLDLPAENRIRATILDPIFQQKLRFPRQLCDAELTALLNDIHAAQQQGGKELWIFADLLKLLAVAAPTLKENEGKTIDIPLRRAIRFMETHYTEKIPLALIAEKAGFNSQYFCSYFKKNTRSTPIQYLNNLRIRHAKELLRKTDLPILEVAMQSGFENVSFFIQKFKSETGNTPAKYRKVR